jgi:hypothetical protein
MIPSLTIAVTNEKRLPLIDYSYKRFVSSDFYSCFYLFIPFVIFIFLTKIDVVYIVVAAFLSVQLYNLTILEHLCLRLILYSKNKIPLRYRTFLNKVSKTGLMEKDGGQWRFRHQLIQDRFADQYSK